MKSDRELLELAAKAAGIKHAICYDAYPEDGFLTAYAKTGKGAYWNPLSDDGDALRLAAKVGMIVDLRYTKPEITQYNRVEYWHVGEPSHMRFFTLGKFGADNDPGAALRKAIVRAAAEIGSAAGIAALGDGGD